MGVVDPFSVARAAGLELIGTPEGLTLTDGTMELRADFGRMLPRLKQGRLQQELLVKAARTKGIEQPWAIDATAGSGADALLRAAAAKAGVSDITQKKDVLRFTLAVFRPEALVQVCGLAKYKFRLTLSAGETPMLTLKLKPGADVLETALELVEDLKLATQTLEKA